MPEFMNYVIAALLGLGLGWLMVRNRDVDFSKIRVLNKNDFVSNMRRGQLVDMRKKEAFLESKIKGARNFKPRDLKAKNSKLRKDNPVYLYCANGRKSKRIARNMIRRDFQAIYVLEGGFENYSK